MSGQRLIVIGGAGYLGGAVVHEAAQRGCNMVIYDRQTGEVAGQPVRALDIRDAEAVRAAIEPDTVVINFAGIADLNAAKEMPREVLETNVLGNLNILEACRAAGTRKYCFASTAYVYSLHGSFYRISKRTCEEYIIEYKKRYGVDYVILRYGSLYGGKSNLTNGLHRIVSAALADGVLRYGGEPNDSREFIHVADASAISLDLALGEARNEAFLLTGAERITMQQLFDIIQEILDRPLKVEFGDGSSANHYRMTQYNFAPVEARKVFSNKHVDIGNGLLRLIEKLHLELSENRDGSAPSFDTRYL